MFWIRACVRDKCPDCHRIQYHVSREWFVRKHFDFSWKGAVFKIEKGGIKLLENLSSTVVLGMKTYLRLFTIRKVHARMSFFFIRRTHRKVFSKEHAS